jgi:hypothetical protein
MRRSQRPLTGASLIRIIQEVPPTEIYNLAAQSHVQVSFGAAECRRHRHPAPARAIGILGIEGIVRLYQLSTSETFRKFGNSPVGNEAVLLALALRRRHGHPLDHGELLRSLRHSCLRRNSVQPLASVIMGFRGLAARGDIFGALQQLVRGQYFGPSAEAMTCSSSMIYSSRRAS